VRQGDRRQLSSVGRAIRFVLTNPLAMALKAPVKDALWTVRCRRLANPPPPASVRSMLFVCKGNICRSPFAALRAAQLAAESGAAIACLSAGIATTQAERSPREACDAAEAFGVRLGAHRPIQITPSVVSQADLIIVMEAAQLLALRLAYPDSAGRIWLLSLLDERRGYARYHIADPFGKPRAEFDACYRRIDGALRPLLRLLVPPRAAEATWP
jgi:protein-tyrosine phosphatase